MNLAFRMRPQKLLDYLGQEHIVGKGKLLSKMLEGKQLFSMILWGPPGSGKTTLAQLIAKETDAAFYQISGVNAGKADLQKVIEEARKNLTKPVTLERSDSIPLRSYPPLQSLSEASQPLRGFQDDKQLTKKTILFIDEIHRWNKAQQDALLPHVESGLVTLIGATTENPSFEVISALLSRSRVLVIKGLEQKDLEKLIDKALVDKEVGLGSYKMKINSDAKELLTRFSGGDARIMLNALEIAVTSNKQKAISTEIIQEVFQTKSAGIYDKKADEHYNIISAFIKSMRGSDVDASLYYLARMLENGEDPKFIARRMIIFASEDIGLADRGALIQANACFEAVNKIGMPESQLILAHIVVYLASAKKSRATTNALGRAKAAVYEYPNEPIPLHIRNAPTKLMKDLGYGKDYTWSDNYVGPARNATHNVAGGPKNALSFLPEKLKNKKFYE